MQKNKSEHKPITIVELNEFNLELVKQALKTNDLPNLKKVFEFKQSSYKTNDRYNSGYLEPWVQWVSIHTGTPSSEHRIKHLGDVPDLTFKPFWEVLSELGVSTGVWGVMNAPRGKSPRNKFFFPDPWTFTEKAYPDPLNRFLDLPRYLSKNYRNLKKTILIKKGFKLLKGVLSSGIAMQIVKDLFVLRKELKKYGKHHYVYISWFDVLVTKLFCKLKDTYQPDVNVIFLNSLAHLQHHHWTQGEKEVTPQILHGLKKIDQLFGILFKRYPNDIYIVHNGLSQMNTNHEKPWVLYRQKDPFTCLQQLGLNPTKVEQHMTHDGHAFFESKQARDEACDRLKSIKVLNQPLFKVEKNEHDETKLFYMLVFTDNIEKDTTFELDGEARAFFDLFDEIVTRTGRHIPVGTILSSEIHFPDHIFNHEFNQYIYHYFKPQKFDLQAEYIEDEQQKQKDEQVVCA